MEEVITCVGLDAHKKSISVAVLVGNGKEFVESTVPNEAAEIRKFARKLKRSAAGELRCCYEAGPIGYALQRLLVAEGVACDVIAPSLIPRKPGDRVKTDRRDARKLAELFRAGLLTDVRPPTPKEEAVRDLCRCREDAKEDQMRARHRLDKFLVRRGLIYTGGSLWTTTHASWIATIRFEHEADKAVLGDYRHALELIDERLKVLDAKLEEIANAEPYRVPVGWLQCFHGIGRVSAMMMIAELHDIRRFESARALMAYLGLVPSEHSSGGREVRGSITKAGNRHVRRLLVEASHHFRHPPKVGRSLQKRREGQPQEAKAMADRAHLRLHRRYWKLVNAGKATNKAKVAVARELAGFVWAALRRAQDLAVESTTRTKPVEVTDARDVLAEARGTKRALPKRKLTTRTEAAAAMHRSASTGQRRCRGASTT